MVFKKVFRLILSIVIIIFTVVNIYFLFIDFEHNYYFGVSAILMFIAEVCYLIKRYFRKISYITFKYIIHTLICLFCIYTILLCCTLWSNKIGTFFAAPIALLVLFVDIVYVLIKHKHWHNE